MCFGGLGYAFCVSGKSGNPSFVIASKPGDPVDQGTCCRLARHVDCEVTWAQWQPDSNTYQLRYFVANGEIDFCGHGTLAAAAWLFQHHQLPSPISLRVLNRIISVQQNEPGYWSYEQEAFPLVDITESEVITHLLHSLGLTNPDYCTINQVKAYRSSGAVREKLVIAFPDRTYLEAMQINGQSRDHICESLNTTGIYAFCDISDPQAASIAARHFPIYSGDNEDMATGAIASTVANHISKNKTHSTVNIFQGGKHAQHSRILVSTDRVKNIWHVGGQCLATEYISLQQAFSNIE